MNAERNSASLLLIGVLLASSMFAACGKEEKAPPPPPTVTVSAPIESEVVEWDEYPGHLESPRVVNVSARVSGIVEKAPIPEGGLVNEGDVLFLIDNRPFKADLASKKAALARAQSQFSQADIKFKRFEKVRDTKAISLQDFDEVSAARQQADAEVAAAKAAVDVAELNLSWTNVTAPTAGRVSRKLVTEGNLVNGGAGQASVLTTITSVDPLYVYFNVPEDEFLKYQRLVAEQKKQGVANYQLPSAIKLTNEKNYGHDGVIDFIDNQVDTNTGTIQLRGLIPNPDGTLTSGLFARARVKGSNSYKTLLVPDNAVGTDQNKKFLLIVGADGLVEARPVKLGVLFGTMRAIAEGLKKEDQVVIKGVQYARPGSKVNPVSDQIKQSAELVAASSPVPTTTATPAHAPAPAPTPTPSGTPK